MIARDVLDVIRFDGGQGWGMCISLATQFFTNDDRGTINSNLRDAGGASKKHEIVTFMFRDGSWLRTVRDFHNSTFGVDLESMLCNQTNQ